MILLRISLALVFLWFGLLKLFGVSPVVDVIAQAFPAIAEVPALYTALAIVEIVVGVGLLIPRFVTVAAWIAAGHLAIATISVLLSPQAFNGSFPFLSLTGEFVIKNLVLIAAAITLARNRA